MRALVEARIDRLPETFRTVFMLRAVEGMRVKEIARALDIPEATVRTRFFRLIRAEQAAPGCTAQGRSASQDEGDD
jgi:DNA-directed RNA polymerase specialized sigma24 family protein